MLLKGIKRSYIRLILITALVIVGLTQQSVHLAASTKKIENDKIFYNTSGIPNEEAWEKQKAEEARLAAIRARQTTNLATYQGSHACNCVEWAQAHGLNVNGYGLAINYPAPNKVPSAEGFVVTYESRPGTYTGHIAKYVLSGLYLILTEANYKSCQITTGRIISIDSPLIKGYIN